MARDLGSGCWAQGVIALPLAIAFGIALGVKPGQGLLTAIIAGFHISEPGGPRFQIGDPTGVFVQLYEVLGLALKRSGHVSEPFARRATQPSTVNWHVPATFALTLAIDHGWPVLTQEMPASIVAVIATTLFVAWLGWPVRSVKKNQQRTAW